MRIKLIFIGLLLGVVLLSYHFIISTSLQTKYRLEAINLALKQQKNSLFRLKLPPPFFSYQQRSYVDINKILSMIESLSQLHKVRLNTMDFKQEKHAGNYDAFLYQLSLTGDYSSILVYLKALTDLPCLMVFEQVKLGHVSSQSNQLNMDIEIIFLLGSTKHD